MKKYLLSTGITLIALVLFMATSGWADMLVIDVDPPDTDANPDRLPNSNPVTEEIWLEGLLGAGADIFYLGKDEKIWNDVIWSEWDKDNSIWVDSPSVPWTYAVLKYGNKGPPNPTHWAVIDDNDNDKIDFSTISGLPGVQRLSHITYFGNNSAPVPEPSTVLLLGAGLCGLTGFRRKLKIR